MAHVTLRGLEALTRGQIDLSDPRLDGGLGTVQLELHAGPTTANQMEEAIKTAQAMFGPQGALKILDDAYIIPWRVKVALVTSGDSELDGFIKDKAKQEGHELKVATS